MVSVDLQCAVKLEEFHEEQNFPVGGTHDRGAGGTAAAHWPQRLTHKELNGVINGYSPQTTTGTTPATTTTGPYEIRGPWSLKLTDSGKAEFYAALNMELSDGWALSENKGDFDPTMRDPHTHHISLVDCDVTRLANGEFQVSGRPRSRSTETPRPFHQQLWSITITGGSDVEFSNITLTFGLPGCKHSVRCRSRGWCERKDERKRPRTIEACLSRVHFNCRVAA